MEENVGIFDMGMANKGEGARLSSATAVLIAKGLVADRHFDLDLYRTIVELTDRNTWMVDFVLKERYRHFNVGCATVHLDATTGVVREVGFRACNEPPVIEHATRSLPSSLPNGGVGIYLGEEKMHVYEIAPWEWEALFWDELEATDPGSFDSSQSPDLSTSIEPIRCAFGPGG